ncbi:MAG: SPOR domain-containing protein [Elusimicrobia bacterium]|nr:SPOR domain-containing protein [Elusimicrobiota bacterium]
MRETIIALLVAVPVHIAVQAAETAPSGLAAVSLAAIVTEDDRVEFHFSSPARERVRFDRSPPRLMIDWENANLTAAAKTFEGKGAVLKGVRAAQLSTEPIPVARAVVDMTGYAIYGIDWDGNVMHLAMGAAAMRPRALQSESGQAARPTIPLRKKAQPQAVQVQAKPAETPEKPTQAAAPAKLPPPSLAKTEPDPASGRVPPAKPAAAPPAKPEAAPAKAPAGKTSGQFLVQVGSFGDEARAQALKKAIEGAFLSVAVLPVSVSGKTFYQVRVGPFDGRPAAQEASDKLKGLGHAAAYVLTKK